MSAVSAARKPRKMKSPMAIARHAEVRRNPVLDAEREEIPAFLDDDARAMNGAARKARHIHTDLLAKHAHTNRSTVQNYENGKSENPTLLVAVLLMRAYNTIKTGSPFSAASQAEKNGSAYSPAFNGGGNPVREIVAGVEPYQEPEADVAAPPSELDALELLDQIEDWAAGLGKPYLKVSTLVTFLQGQRDGLLS